MTPQSKRATAGTVTLVQSRPGRRSNTNPSKELMMQSNTTSLPVTATGSVSVDILDKGMNPANDSLSPSPADQSRPDSEKYPSECDPVAIRGRMTASGWKMENSDWLPFLADPDPQRMGRYIGRDPMTLDLDVLAMSGHPNRRTIRVVGAMRTGMGDAEDWYDDVVRHGDIRRHCVTCSAGNLAEVRRCSVINCPFWAYRMGKNPHNARRGKVPAHLVTTQFDGRA